MSASGRDDTAGSGGEVEEESADAKIERLTTEIDELKASLIGVPELSAEWFRIKTDIKDRDIERLLLIEKKRCDDVVKTFFEENPHVLEAAPECPVCLEKMWARSDAVRNVCCGKLLCNKCSSQGGDAFLDACPLCRGEAPGSFDESMSILKEKADSGVAWAQAEMGKIYVDGLFGFPKDIEKGLPLYTEAVEKGSTDAKEFLGEYYFGIENYEEARRWHEAAAAEGEIMSFFRLGMMMNKGQAFEQSEDTRAESFCLCTLSATLLQTNFNAAATELSFFFKDSFPVMLHYLRPAVEGGDTSVRMIDTFALMLYGTAMNYFGEEGNFPPGHSPVPEALFWHRRCSSEAVHAPDDPMVRIEGNIRKICAHCAADLPEGKQSCCMECKAAYYCDRDCQMAHWKAGHKKDCVRKLKKRLRAEGKLDKEK